MTLSAFLPLLVIGGGMYFYMAGSLKTKTIDALQAEVVSHKRSIDLFLSERIMDLKFISQNNNLAQMVSQDRFDRIFTALQQEKPYFEDMGIIGSDGNHLAYIGPYDLKGKNYRETRWFKIAMSDGVYVSDVFTGFRNQPHFIIAVKRRQGEVTWILRATVVSGLFDNIVTRVAQHRDGDAYLINSQGVFQTNPRKGGGLMMISQVPVPQRFEGVQVDEKGSAVTLTTWLEAVPWLSVVSIQKKDIFKELHKVRTTGLFVALLGGFIIVLTVLFTTDSLVMMLEDKRKNLRRLDNRLRTTASFASSMELSKGVFSDLNDILSNIHVTAILVNEEVGHASVSETCFITNQILTESIRGRNLIDSFLKFVGTEDPVIMEVDVHLILDRILGFLKASLIEKNMSVVAHWGEGCPAVRSDGTALRQVFQDLLLNAVAVTGANGAIGVSTSVTASSVVVSVSDAGLPLQEAEVSQLFDPHYSTGRGDSSLGLSISQRIMERLGGSLTAKNGEEQGVVFEIEIPKEFMKESLKA